MSRIAFDTSVEDDSDDNTLASVASNLRSSPRKTPQKRAQTQTPRTQQSGPRQKATARKSTGTRDTPRAPWDRSRNTQDSPQPGPSHRPDPMRAPALNLTSRRKQNAPKQRTKVDKEIWKLQHTVDMLIPKAPFCRVVKELLTQHMGPEARIQSEALLALQEMAEMYMVQFLEDANRCTLHAKRVTLQMADMQLARIIRRDATF